MRALAVVAVLAFGSALAGCPPLSDDYEVVDGNDASAGASSGGAGGGTAGAGGGSAGAAGMPTCTRGSCTTTCCGSECVDLSTDTAHCGACDAPCTNGRNCNFGSCGPPGWIQITSSDSAPSAREMAAHVWTGQQVFIWGGADASGTALDDGALYDPVSGVYSPIAKTANTPSPRVLATAVHIAGKVVVFGGGDAMSNADYKNGGIYDLASKSWTVLEEAPFEARAPIGAAAGTDRVLFWGGFDKSGKPISSIALLTVSTGQWSTPSNATAPPGLLHPAWAVSSSDLYLYGGRPDGSGHTDLAWRASLIDGIWSTLPKGPSARFGSFGAWDGASFFVWSGTDGSNLKNDGKLFAGATWAAVDDKGTPPASRWASHRRSGWATAIGDGRFLILGGVDVLGTTVQKTGGIYDHATGTWTSLDVWGSGEAHEWGVAVWTGVELVLWGGRNGASVTNTGQRYLPPPG